MKPGPLLWLTFTSTYCLFNYVEDTSFQIMIVSPTVYDLSLEVSLVVYMDAKGSSLTVI